MNQGGTWKIQLNTQEEPHRFTCKTAVKMKGSKQWWVVMESAGPYANHLHLDGHQHLITQISAASCINKAVLNM